MRAVPTIRVKPRQKRLRKIVASYDAVIVMPGGELGKRVASAIRDVAPETPLTIVDRQAEIATWARGVEVGVEFARSVTAVLSDLPEGAEVLVIIATAMYGDELLVDLAETRRASRFDVLDYPRLAMLDQDRFATREYRGPSSRRLSLAVVAVLLGGRADLRSWVVLARRSMFWRTRRRFWLRSKATVGNIYLEPKASKHLRFINLLDAGAFDGDSIPGFTSEFSGRLRAYIAVEPLQDVQALLRSRLFAIGDDVLIRQEQCVLGSSAGSPYPLRGRGKSSHIGDSIDVTAEERQVVRSTTVDSLEKEVGAPFNFMKFDIEGAEVSALSGISNVRGRDGTVLAISVYHMRDQLNQVARWLRSERVRMKVWLRHYGNEVDNLVLYVRLKGSVK